MKNIVLALAGIVITCNLHAQQRQYQRTSAVYITINGNKNLQVEIDGTTYNLNNINATVSKTNTPINDLSTGLHTLTLTGSAANTNNNNRRYEDANITTQFNLRRNFDMYITLNTDGSLELIEKRRGSTTNRNTAMSATDFNTLNRNLRAQRTTQSRNALLTTTFNAPNTYFTSVQVVQLLQQVTPETDRLQLAKLSYRTVTNPENFSPVYGLFGSSANRKELQDYVKYYDGSGRDNNDNNNRGGMQESNFNSLYQTIKGQWPVSTQVNSLTSAFNTTGNYFTANQAAQLIQLVSSENTRLQLAKLSYRTVVDPANFTAVSNLLYSQSSRDELRLFINNGQVDNRRQPMGETEFNNLYQSINAQFMPFAKMTELTNTFNNAAYYFTAAQARTLIQLVSSETNRLQLAKSAYRNLVDRENYIQLNDLFLMQSSKTEWNAYVQAYRD